MTAHPVHDPQSRCDFLELTPLPEAALEPPGIPWGVVGWIAVLLCIAAGIVAWYAGGVFDAMEGLR